MGGGINKRTNTLVVLVHRLIYGAAASLNQGGLRNQAVRQVYRFRRELNGDKGGAVLPLDQEFRSTDAVLVGHYGSFGHLPQVAYPDRSADHLV